MNRIDPTAGGPPRTEAEPTAPEAKVVGKRVTPWTEAKRKASKSTATKQAPEPSPVEPIDSVEEPG